MTQSVLILGPTGRFGRHTATAFEDAGWEVHRFKRGEDLNAAAQGIDVIVNGWNPVYTEWQAQVPELTDQVIAAAKSSGATVVIPGNVYPFGPGAPERLEASTPHAATNPLGQVRAKMEAAYRASDVPTIILRAGDFLDTEKSGNWFDMIIAAKSDTGRFVYPGDPAVPHAWAFLPDMARAVVALIEKRDALPRFADIPFAGYTLTGTELADLVGRALGKPQRVVGFKWWLIGALRPVWPLARSLKEMSYLWSMPHHLAGDAMAELLPGFVPTPVEEAVAQALEINVHPNKAVA